jgi:hypothetical protein
VGGARCVAVDYANGDGACDIVESNSLCRIDADCNAPLVCVAIPSFAGTCSQGAVGEACRDDEFCASGHCMILDAPLSFGRCE